MANNRIYYAIEAAGLAPLGSTTYVPIHGLQSIGMNLNFNLIDVLEIGQIDVYEIKEDVPEVEITLEKVLDGYPLIYHLSTRGYTANTFAGRQNRRCSLALSVFGDTQNSASGVPIREIVTSGLYYSSCSYSFPADGNFTESVTLVGNNMAVKNAGFDFSGNIFDNTDQPLALVSGLGGVQRRESFLWGSAGTILPQDVEGISASGTNESTNDVLACHVNSINVSMDVGRESIPELGRLGPYYRYATIPAEITTEIEIISTSLHSVQASENSNSNLTNRQIVIKTREGLVIDLGSKNKLKSVSKGGASTGGENETITYSYRTLNNFTVTHPQDPT